MSPHSVTSAGKYVSVTKYLRR